MVPEAGVKAFIRPASASNRITMRAAEDVVETFQLWLEHTPADRWPMVRFEVVGTTSSGGFGVVSEGGLIQVAQDVAGDDTQAKEGDGNVVAQSSVE